MRIGAACDAVVGRRGVSARKARAAEGLLDTEVSVEWIEHVL